MTIPINIKILNQDITEDLLNPSTQGSAGIDLRVMLDEKLDPKLYIYPGQTCLVGTGVAIHIADPGYAGMILPRSGLGNKGLVLGNLVGLIDSDYQGEIKLSLWNRSNDRIVIGHMDRVAQLVIVPVSVPSFTVVSEFTKSARGAGGFGSTGT